MAYFKIQTNLRMQFQLIASVFVLSISRVNQPRGSTTMFLMRSTLSTLVFILPFVLYSTSIIVAHASFIELRFFRVDLYRLHSLDNFTHRIGFRGSKERSFTDAY